MGRSFQTHRVKNKPIGEGYKLFILATFRGFIVNATPDGRMAAKQGNQEYDTKNGEGKIVTMILHLCEIIDKFKARQLARIRSYPRSTRQNSADVFSKKQMPTFCIAMDNYFTLPPVIKKLRDKAIGVVGTARFKRNWPPKELKMIDIKDAEFNDFFYTYDENGTLIARWMDNRLVFLVSTIHQISNIVQRIRRRPRITKLNKNHVESIWGNLGKTSIFIPQLVDHYNH